MGWSMIVTCVRCKKRKAWIWFFFLLVCGFCLSFILGTVFASEYKALKVTAVYSCTVLAYCNNLRLVEVEVNSERQCAMYWHEVLQVGTTYSCLQIENRRNFIVVKSATQFVKVVLGFIFVFLLNNFRNKESEITQTRHCR